MVANKATVSQEPGETLVGDHEGGDGDFDREDGDLLSWRIGCVPPPPHSIHSQHSLASKVLSSQCWQPLLSR